MPNFVPGMTCHTLVTHGTPWLLSLEFRWARPAGEQGAWTPPKARGSARGPCVLHTPEGSRAPMPKETRERGWAESLRFRPHLLAPDPQPQPPTLAGRCSLVSPPRPSLLPSRPSRPRMHADMHTLRGTHTCTHLQGLLVCPSGCSACCCRDWLSEAGRETPPTQGPQPSKRLTLGASNFFFF